MISKQTFFKLLLFLSTLFLGSFVAVLLSHPKPKINYAVVDSPQPYKIETERNSCSHSVKDAATTISGGVVNGKAKFLAQPVLPPAAKAVGASGQVSVQVLIDENGNIVSANAVSGHPLLRAASMAAAKESKFSPTLLSGQPVKVSGTIIYNFESSNPRD